MEVRSDRTPQPARVWLHLSVAALIVSMLAASGCAHSRQPAEREIVWEGRVVIREDVLIAPGERLVIRPGTRVVFAFRDDDGDGAGDARIVIRGSISAVGSRQAPIAFQPADPEPHSPRGWAEVLIEDATGAGFSWCRFFGAQQAVHAHRTPLLVENCWFEGNTIGLRFTGGPVTIRRNRFLANGAAVRYWESSPLVTGNEFEGNATAIFVREGSPHTVVTGNNFSSSADYHIKLGEAQAADVDARGNWWGSDRPEEIERLIYDRRDADYLGRVRYDPPAAGPLRLGTP